MIGTFILNNNGEKEHEPIIQSLQEELIYIGNTIKSDKIKSWTCCEYLYNHNNLILDIETSLPIFFNKKTITRVLDLEIKDGITRIRKFVRSNLKIDDQISIEKLILSDGEADNLQSLKILLSIVEKDVINKKMREDKRPEIRFIYLLSKLSIWQKENIPTCDHFSLIISSKG